MGNEYTPSYNYRDILSTTFIDKFKQLSWADVALKVRVVAVP